ncbi:DNA-binding transcriptional MerR regulator [Desulfohalotomaculum tongense]|uniref:DUF4342 domain-containing protein n=1 Tax=Desulforadius tongensis TaxID=1216062 RepID=UPI00195B4775|nr:DUF4342 domain-containing protein [Desulforadius tongensis]MBM7855795.1 DNA-binding transcriptional MerR regulator [Desulforadius tongensis]
MTSDLEKIDLLRARLGVSYKEAKEALDQMDGDVVQALISLEQRNLHIGEKIQGRGREAVEQLKSLLDMGQSTRIKIKKDGRTVVDIPATLGVAGVVGALYNSELAVLGAVGTLVAMANNYTLEIERQEERQDYSYN